MNSSHSTNWRGISNTEIKNGSTNTGVNNGLISGGTVILSGGDSASTRAYSAAVRVLKPKGANSSTIASGAGMIIPKVSLKKKSPHNHHQGNQINVQGILGGLKGSQNIGHNFRTIQGKSS